MTINGTERAVNPVYEGDLSVVSALETGEVFHRNRLSGEIVFVRDDFDWLLANCAMSDKAQVSLEEFTGTWDALFTGYFYRSDAAIDEDNRTWTVTPQPEDKYDKVVAALDKEFDLVRLDVPRTNILFTQKGLIQVYMLGANFVTNFIGSTHWEQEVITPIFSDLEMQGTYFFGLSRFIFIPGDTDVLDPDVSGQYIDTGAGNNYDHVDGTYRIRLNPSVSLPDIQWEIVTLPGLSAVYRKGLNEGLSNPYAFQPSGYPFQSLTTSDECEAFQDAAYVRILTNEATVDGDATSALPSADIVDENYNYTRALAVEDVDFIGSSLHDSDAGRWGKFASDSLHFAGEYFVRPEPGIGTLFPVNRSDWTQYSAWIQIDSTLSTLLADAGTARTIKDAYRVSDVLKYLLLEIDPTVDHDDAAAYSDFFYSGSNSIRTIRNRLAITPKSNVLKGDYDKPASRAPIKLGELLALLKNAYRAYWYIDSSNRLVLEHIHFFYNGKSYGAAGVGEDLTTLIEPKTGKAWGWRGKRYKYEKEAMPDGFRFAWMDQVSFPFSGYSLDMLSPFVQQGQFEDVNMGPFTSDLQFALVQPSALSPDGFFLFDAEPAGDDLSVPDVAITVSDEEDYTLQNGHASMLYLHNQYHRHALPAPSIRLNGNETTATTVRRSKIQDEDFPAPDGLDPMQLITTTIGTGEVREATTNISSRSLKLTIAHDTE